MRVLLDEGVPRQLAQALVRTGIEATAFPTDWKQMSDGDLLMRAEGLGYRVLVTSDKRMRFQQNFRRRTIGLLILPTNRMPVLSPLLGQIYADVSRIQSGEVRMLGSIGPSTDPR